MVDAQSQEDSEYEEDDSGDQLDSDEGSDTMMGTQPEASTSGQGMGWRVVDAGTIRRLQVSGWVPPLVESLEWDPGRSLPGLPVPDEACR